MARLGLAFSLRSIVLWLSCPAGAGKGEFVFPLFGHPHAGWSYWPGWFGLILGGLVRFGSRAGSGVRWLHSGLLSGGSVFWGPGGEVCNFYQGGLATPSLLGAQYQAGGGAGHSGAVSTGTLPMCSASWHPTFIREGFHVCMVTYHPTSHSLVCFVYRFSFCYLNFTFLTFISEW